MTSKLITAQLADVLKQYPLYSQDGKGKDAICVCTFFIGNVRWYVLEGEPEGDDFTIFSIMLGCCEPEYGYNSIKEMEGITIDTGFALLPKVKIMQDLDFKPCKIGDIPDKRLEEFLSRLYD